MSDRKKEMEKYEAISTIIETQILHIVQTLMNERNALRNELVHVRAAVIDAEKKLEEAEKTIEMLRTQISNDTTGNSRK